jgi:hypothetical protein
LALIAPNYLKKQWANKPFEDSINSSENKRMNEFLCKLVDEQIATERLPRNITEIGCLNGIRLAELSNYLRDDEIIYTGFDINEEAIVFGRTYLFTCVITIPRNISLQIRNFYYSSGAPIWKILTHNRWPYYPPFHGIQ